MDFLIHLLRPVLSQLLNTVFLLGVSLGWKLRGLCLSKVSVVTLQLDSTVAGWLWAIKAPDSCGWCTIKPSHEQAPHN